ncbi:MAG: hypothetical protein JWO49_787 [Arthrobacter sp.]|nr:hypothetical protein [Arthrobacter sp.]
MRFRESGNGLGGRRTGGLLFSRRGGLLGAKPALLLFLAGFLFLIPAEVDDVRIVRDIEAEGVLGNDGLALPFLGLGGAAHCGQGIGIGAEQARAVGEGPVNVQLDDLQLRDGGVKLPQIGTGAGSHDGELRLTGGVEILGFVGARHVEGAVRATEATFTVSHDGQMHIGAADPPVGAEFAQGLAVVSGGVGGQANGLADCCEASTSTAGCEGMLESELWLVVNQAPGHHQVACNPLGAVVFERLDLVLRCAVQFLARDVLVDLGRTLPVGAVGTAEIPGVRYAHRTVFFAVAAKLAWAGVAAVKTPGRTILAVGEGLPVVAAAEGLTIPIATKAATLTTFTRRTVTKGLTITIATKAATLTTFTRRTVTKGLTITIATTTKRLTIPITRRTVTKRLTITIATTTERLTIPITGRTLTKRLTITIATKAATLTTFTRRTVTKRLTITIVVGRSRPVGAPVVSGAETARLAT